MGLIVSTEVKKYYLPAIFGNYSINVKTVLPTRKFKAAVSQNPWRKCSSYYEQALFFTVKSSACTG